MDRHAAEIESFDLDCASCGACCREAFHVVEVEQDDPFATVHRSLLELQDGRLVLPRPWGMCVALKNEKGCGFRCSVYDSRPVTCREFEVGSQNCVDARKRVGVA